METMAKLASIRYLVFAYSVTRAISSASTIVWGMLGKLGSVPPIFKKGRRSDKDSFRGAKINHV
jgi:hypothetical protein